MPCSYQWPRVPGHVTLSGITLAFLLYSCTRWTLLWWHKQLTDSEGAASNISCSLWLYSECQHQQLWVSLNVVIQWHWWRDHVVEGVTGTLHLVPGHLLQPGHWAWCGVSRWPGQFIWVLSGGSQRSTDGLVSKYKYCCFMIPPFQFYIVKTINGWILFEATFALCRPLNINVNINIKCY